MLVGEGGLEIKSGGEIGLKPYNASKGENLVEEWTELLKIQQGAMHATTHGVVHGQSLLESAQ